MRDPRVLRATKVICTVFAVWALVAWLSKRNEVSKWPNSAPLPIPQDDQLQSTQVFIPSIRKNPASLSYSSGRFSKIAKVAMFSYQNSTMDTALYEDALRSHKAHNDRYGYLHHVLRRSLISVQYSKPAYILSVILQELVKPPAERLEWLV